MRGKRLSLGRRSGVFAMREFVLIGCCRSKKSESLFLAALAQGSMWCRILPITRASLTVPMHPISRRPTTHSGKCFSCMLQLPFVYRVKFLRWA